ncbi:CHAT domain-containing protein [Ascidiimonas sp. W6]|uniref:CHAT domain-containing protein n=1 Tax=Ascidiimonas meishanensis TaxID=3128903 RepID=UPI0030EB94CF
MKLLKPIPFFSYYSFYGILLCICSYAQAQNITQDTIQANTYYIKADSLSKQAQYDSAINYCKKASTLYKKYELWQHYLKAENIWGDLLRRTGQYGKAIGKMEKTIAIAKQYHLGQSPEVGVSLNIIGNSNRELGKFDQALAQHQKALKIGITHFGEQHPHVADSYNGIGNVYRELGKYDQVLAQHQKALKIQITHFGEQHPDVAYSYNGIGDHYRRSGKYDQALAQDQKALKIRMAHFGEQHPDVAASYNNIGKAYIELGKFDQGLEQFQKALNIKIAHFGEQHSYIAEMYNNIGVYYSYVGKYHKALEQHQKALKIRIAYFDGEHPSVFQTHYNMGIAYTDLGKYDQALEQYQIALKIAMANFGGQHYTVASCYDNMGIVYKALGKYNQALEQHQKTLRIGIALFGNQHPEIADTYISMGNICCILGNYSQALHYYQNALHSNDASVSMDSFTSQPGLKNHLDANILLQALSEKGKTLRLIAKDGTVVARPLARSLNTYQVADTLIQSMRRNTPYEKDKLDLAKNSTLAYQGAVSTAIKLHQKHHERHYLDKAFYFSEQNRASILLGSQAQRRALQFANVPDHLISLEKELKINKSFYTKQLQRQKDSASVSYNQDQLFKINRRLDSVTTLMETTYPNYYQMKYSPKIIPLGAVQKQLAEDELLLQYLWGEEVLYGFSITKDDVEVHEIPIDSTLLKIPKAFMSHFQGWDGIDNVERLSSISELESYTYKAYTLYKTLVAPLLTSSTKATKKLIIIPDGPLSRIPFEVLVTQPPTTKNRSFKFLPYLIKDYAIRYGFSSSLSFETAKTRTIDKELIAFGGFAPTYQGSNLYVKQTQDSLENMVTERTLRSIYTESGSLSPLTYNIDEVQDINNHLGGHIFTGEAATVEQFKRLAPNYRILHIAAHGFVNDSLPEYSGIAFTKNKGQDKGGSYNFLQMHEIYNMELHADLVVLSACQTGVGRFQQGEGVMNLGRAFRHVGSPNVLISQWNANDAKTSELMGYFYKHITDGMDKDLALQQAKLQLLDNNPIAHPFYWGTFTLWGDGNPIHKTKNDYWWLVIGSLVSVGVFFVYRYRRKVKSQRA